MTTQNVYDDPAFFAGHATLRQNPLSANAVLEEPTMRALASPLNGRRLDLDWGAGGLSRFASEQGATSVAGVVCVRKDAGAGARRQPDARGPYT